MYEQFGETPLDKRATGDMTKDKSSRDNSRLVQDIYQNHDTSQLLPAIGNNSNIQQPDAQKRESDVTE